MATSEAVLAAVLAAAKANVDPAELPAVTALVRLAERVEALGDRLHVDPTAVLVALEQVAAREPLAAANPLSSLTAQDEAVLRAAGSLGHAMPALGARASTRTAVRTARLVEDSLSVNEVADLLGVSGGLIRQRLATRSLFGIQGARGWRLPRVQFGDHGSIDGLDAVVRALPADTHPLTFVRFLTTVHPDLRVDGRPTNPRTWLLTGGPPGPVVALADGLHRMP